jgi:hypothetical protein
MPEGPKQVFVERLGLLRSAAGQPTYESIERGAGQILDPGKRNQRGQTLTAPSHKRIHDWCNGRAVPARGRVLPRRQGGRLARRPGRGATLGS